MSAKKTAKSAVPLILGHNGTDNLYEQDPWRVFRILSEFVLGFDTLLNTAPAITIFGSARSKPESSEYKAAVTIAESLAKDGYTIITGGGPGVMEGANRGAFIAQGKSIGLNIQLPMEQSVNPYVNLPIGFRHFFVRKVMFLKYASAVIVMPGGFGTMDECFEVLTLVQTKKIKRIPIILYDSSFWGGLIDWLKKTMLKEKKMVSESDFTLFKIMDNPHDVIAEIKKSTKPTQRKINF